MITAGGDYVPSLLLLDEIWSGGTLDVEGEIVIAIPTRDVLLFTGSGNKEGVKKLRELAKKTARRRPYSLTDRLFVYRGGKFERLLGVFTSRAKPFVLSSRRPASACLPGAVPSTRASVSSPCAREVSIRACATISPKRSSASRLLCSCVRKRWALMTITSSAGEPASGERSARRARTRSGSAGHNFKSQRS